MHSIQGDASGHLSTVSAVSTTQTNQASPPHTLSHAAQSGYHHHSYATSSHTLLAAPPKYANPAYNHSRTLGVGMGHAPPDGSLDLTALRSLTHRLRVLYTVHRHLCEMASTTACACTKACVRYQTMPQQMQGNGRAGPRSAYPTHRPPVYTGQPPALQGHDSRYPRAKGYPMAPRPRVISRAPAPATSLSGYTHSAASYTSPGTSPQKEEVTRGPILASSASYSATGTYSVPIPGLLAKVRAANAQTARQTPSNQSMGVGGSGQMTRIHPYSAQSTVGVGPAVMPLGEVNVVSQDDSVLVHCGYLPTGRLRTGVTVYDFVCAVPCDYVEASGSGPVAASASEYQGSQLVSSPAVLEIPRLGPGTTSDPQSVGTLSHPPPQTQTVPRVTSTDQYSPGSGYHPAVLTTPGHAAIVASLLGQQHKAQTETAPVVSAPTTQRGKGRPAQRRQAVRRPTSKQASQYPRPKVQVQVGPVVRTHYVFDETSVVTARRTVEHAVACIRRYITEHHSGRACVKLCLDRLLASTPRDCGILAHSLASLIRSAGLGRIEVSLVRPGHHPMAYTDYTSEWMPGQAISPGMGVRWLLPDASAHPSPSRSAPVTDGSVCVMHPYDFTDVAIIYPEAPDLVPCAYWELFPEADPSRAALVQTHGPALSLCPVGIRAQAVHPDTVRAVHEVQTQHMEMAQRETQSETHSPDPMYEGQGVGDNTRGSMGSTTGVNALTERGGVNQGMSLGVIGPAGKLAPDHMGDAGVESRRDINPPMMGDILSGGLLGGLADADLGSFGSLGSIGAGGLGSLGSVGQDATAQGLNQGTQPNTVGDMGVGLGSIPSQPMDAPGGFGQIAPSSLFDASFDASFDGLGAMPTGEDTLGQGVTGMGSIIQSVGGDLLGDVTDLYATGQSLNIPVPMSPLDSMDALMSDMTTMSAPTLPTSPEAEGEGEGAGGAEGDVSASGEKETPGDGKADATGDLHADPLPVSHSLMTQVPMPLGDMMGDLDSYGSMASLGSLGAIGSMGSMGDMGDMGDMRSFGSLGSLGSIGSQGGLSLGSLGSIPSVGTDSGPGLMQDVPQATTFGSDQTSAADDTAGTAQGVSQPAPPQAPVPPLLKRRAGVYHDNQVGYSRAVTRVPKSQTLDAPMADRQDRQSQQLVKVGADAQGGRASGYPGTYSASEYSRDTQVPPSRPASIRRVYVAPASALPSSFNLSAMAKGPSAAGSASGQDSRQTQGDRAGGDVAGGRGAMVAHPSSNGVSTMHQPRQTLTPRGMDTGARYGQYDVDRHQQMNGYADSSVAQGSGLAEYGRRGGQGRRGNARNAQEPDAARSRSTSTAHLLSYLSHRDVARCLEPPLQSDPQSMPPAALSERSVGLLLNYLRSQAPTSTPAYAGAGHGAEGTAGSNPHGMRDQWHTRMSGSVAALHAALSGAGERLGVEARQHIAEVLSHTEAHMQSNRPPPPPLPPSSGVPPSPMWDCDVATRLSLDPLSDQVREACIDFVSQDHRMSVLRRIRARPVYPNTLIGHLGDMVGRGLGAELFNLDSQSGLWGFP
ncbi:hypothetical protein KIPB_006115 [Kipferlia bialata]|uniref:Uncharacterized protein n=1 Tax=Kipferlia bialata TaxID=797122 RepID=A0A9K3CY68_9EUKA|nr:hypothetical protein KIPB_006115 [Kipferlia bialata]|eukprot:g6115.t1